MFWMNFTAGCINGEIFIWSTWDLCRLKRTDFRLCPYSPCRKILCSKENIIIGVIHTHSGPDISFEDEGEDRNHRKAVYREYVMKQLLNVDECFFERGLEVTPYKW